MRSRGLTPVSKTDVGEFISCASLLEALTGDNLLDELAWIEAARLGFVPNPQLILSLKEVWRNRMKDLSACLTLANYSDESGGNS